MRKNKKNTKIQSVFLAAIEKYKKNTKVQGVFFSYFFLYLFCIFFVFLQKKYEKNTKKIRIQNLKNTKYKKNTNPKSRKYKIQKKYEKNTNPKSQKYKIRKKKANPMFTFGRKTQIAKKMQKQHVVFSTPCSSDFVFSSRIIFVFFLYF